MKKVLLAFTLAITGLEMFLLGTNFIPLAMKTVSHHFKKALAAFK